MPKTIETTVYQFDELSDKAKEKARRWYRDASAGDNYFAESVIEDADNIARLFGLTFNQRPFETIGGGTRTEPAVSWSGFSSQGDGASFEGTYSHKPGALEAVKSEAPTDGRLHAIVAAIEEAQAKYNGKIAARITTSGRYSHAFTMQFEFELNGEEDGEIDAATEESLIEAFRDFANWIYRNLEKEYDWQNADEQVDETIRANEYDFMADGRRSCV